MLAKVNSFGLHGIDCYLVTAEADISRGLPSFDVVGLPDAAVREAYMNDPFCTFQFTVSAMGDLIRLIKYANRKAWFKALPTDLPILLVSGTDDPVGDYGKGVETVRDRLAAAGKDVTCILYEGYRHEILNDDCHHRVVSDIRTFIAKTQGVKP